MKKLNGTEYCGGSVATFSLVGILLLILLSCEKDPDPIVPTDGYDWPDNERDYWPTQEWRTASMENHQMDASKMDLVLVLKYEAEDPVHPETGSAHDDMHLFDLVVEAIIE